MPLYSIPLTLHMWMLSLYSLDIKQFTCVLAPLQSFQSNLVPLSLLQCNPSLPADSSPPDFWHLLLKCLPAAFLWGFGTTLGELPPYAACYAAAKKNHLQDLEDPPIESLDEYDDVLVSVVVCL